MVANIKLLELIKFYVGWGKFREVVWLVIFTAKCAKNLHSGERKGFAILITGKLAALLLMQGFAPLCVFSPRTLRLNSHYFTITVTTRHPQPSNL
ncbi:hypothetical protein BC343_28100 [Mucilaginibacter pedocola]|uniref:Uncharacterized protein n=1 Tax=Mucilaginibacter pedocola TaxID=1792845 RepID=A0A1S9PEJ6_9SPHI|nr:hypothetical protein BC343_28100 [Mucilaginibacter pedocola]